MNNNIGKNQRGSNMDLVMMAGIVIIFIALMLMLPGIRYPWSITIYAGAAVLCLFQILLAKRAADRQKTIEKSQTILEWTVPRRAWHITEARWFSPLFLLLFFIIGFAVFFSSLAVGMKLHPPDHIGEDTLTIGKLPAVSAAASAFCVAVYASSWCWARVRVKLTTHGVRKTFHNSSRTWKYDRIRSYWFETLRSECTVYTLVVFRNHKGKTGKMALEDSVDRAKIEEILKKHGIPKVEQAAS